jgi:hypothetical protein
LKKIDKKKMADLGEGDIDIIKAPIVIDNVSLIFNLSRIFRDLVK